MDITGRKLFVKAMMEEGVDTIFGYPGGMVTDLFDELYKQDDIHLVLPRHEQGLIHEAEGYARATGKPGVCLVTSGPGATNIITGLADAHFDSIPLVCITGQVPLPLIGNDAFQEVDIVGMTRSITKYGVTVRDRKDLGKIIRMAFHIATTGKPGPVLVDIPKDIQLESGPSDYPKSVQIRGYKPNEGVHIGQLKKAYKLLKSAKKPLILAGGGINIARANDIFDEFVTKMQVPVVTTIMGKGAIGTSNPYYMGNCGMHGRYAANMAVSECDVLFSIGNKSDEIYISIPDDKWNEFADKFSVQVYNNKADYKRNSLIITVLLALLGGVVTYFISGHALRPIREFSDKIEEVQAQNLAASRIEENKVKELNQLSVSYNKMLERLSDAFEIQRQFTANAAHELRTPLSLMQVQLDLYNSTRHPDNDADTLQTIKMVTEQNGRLSKMVKTLLDMSELQTVGRV